MLGASFIGAFWLRVRKVTNGRVWNFTSCEEEITNDTLYVYIKDSGSQTLGVHSACIGAYFESLYKEPIEPEEEPKNYFAI